MSNLTRRKFITATALAVGFAISARPISAQVITTDSEGLVAGEVKIPVADGEIPAYRARPATEGNFPLVLVVQEIFGVHEHIQDVCRRLGKLGYMAIAPELYARQGDVSQLSSIQEIISQVVSKVPDEQVMSDLDATVAWANNSGQANSDKLAITGFCWGGRIVWLYSYHNPKVKAGVAWYGRLVGESTSLTPKHPIDIAGELKVPILGLYGGSDRIIPNDTVERMRRVLDAGDSRSEILLYENTPHGFHADYRPTYRKDQAEDGWERLRHWFKRNGVI